MGIDGVCEVSAAVPCCFLPPTGLCQCWCCCLGSLFWLGVEEGKDGLSNTDKPGPDLASCRQRCCKFHSEAVFDCKMQFPKLILLWVQKPVQNNSLLWRPERNNNKKKNHKGEPLPWARATKQERALLGQLWLVKAWGTPWPLPCHSVFQMQGLKETVTILAQINMEYNKLLGYPGQKPIAYYSVPNRETGGWHDVPTTLTSVKRHFEFYNKGLAIRQYCDWYPGNAFSAYPQKVSW